MDLGALSCDQGFTVLARTPGALTHCWHGSLNHRYEGRLGGNCVTAFPKYPKVQGGKSVRMVSLCASREFTSAQRNAPKLKGRASERRP